MSVDTITIRTGRGQYADIKVGDFLSEILVTDTRIYEIIKITAKTVTLRDTKRGAVVRSVNIGGNPYPVSYEAAESLPTALTRTRRIRKDGSIKMANWGHPMYPAQTIDGIPVSRTDYRE